MGDDLARNLPKSLWVHSYEFSDVLAQFHGVIDAELSFDKFFLLGTLTHRMIKLIRAAKRKGLMDRSRVGFLKENKINPDENVMNKLTHLWTTNVYMVIMSQRNRPELWANSEVWWTPPRHGEIKLPHEVMPLPALKHMKPVNQIKDSNLLIHIKETVPVKFGLRDVDVNQLSLSGGMVYNFADGPEPIFRSKEDILNSNARSYWVGRAWWYAMMNPMQEIYLDYFSEFYMDNHISINKLKFGDSEDYRKPKVADVTPLW